MKETAKFKDCLGGVKLYQREGMLLVKPKGIINPNLVLRELKFAEDFALTQDAGWLYLVDTSQVIFPNPLNLFLLIKIKRLPGSPRYGIYAPSKIVRLMAKLTSFIIRPDLVISDPLEFERLLK